MSVKVSRHHDEKPMPPSPIISPTIARRLAIASQYLAGPRPNPDAASIMQVVNRLGCLQLDPINIVARSPLLVLWSRLGAYDPALLDILLWQERRLFEYWAHAASIVLTQDYPIHQMLMRAYATQSSPWSQRMSGWMEQNDALRISTLNALRERGPLRSRDIEDTSEEAWQSTGWTNERNVSRMIDFLWLQGQILVARRVSGEKWWDLMERCLPGWVSYEPLPEREVVRRAAQKSLRALGVATERDIAQHFTRDRYPGLRNILAELEAEGQIVRVRIQGPGTELPGTWFIHADMLPTLEELTSTAWEPRTTLLSPFDNLICDRKRTERLFGFTYQSEIYTPKIKRRYGYYVMPILHDDRLIGRIDPAMDRQHRTLIINAVHTEPGIPITGETAQAITSAIEELTRFLGGTTITYGDQMPQGWKPFLKG